LKAWKIVAAVVAVAAVLAFALRGTIAERLMRVVAARVMTADPIAELGEGIHVVLCGAGSPLADAKRSGPCVAVVAGGRLFEVDAGSGAARRLQLENLPPARLEAVFLTHFHSDHIDGLGELALQHWAGGNHSEPLLLVGPPGVGEVAAGFNAAYRLDSTYRVAHHGADVVPPSGFGLEPRSFPAPQPGREEVVWDEDGVKVTAFQVRHDPVKPAVGYRFDHAGRSVVLSGDTAPSAELERMSQGVDLLVHEALSAELVGILHDAALQAGLPKRAKILSDIVGYHTTPVQAAEIAQRVGAGQLLLYHIVPPLPLPGMESVFLEGVSDAYTGPVTLGRDGTRISLAPAR
jgi:ribonuclease Z